MALPHPEGLTDLVARIAAACGTGSETEIADRLAQHRGAIDAAMLAAVKEARR